MSSNNPYKNISLKKLERIIEEAFYKNPPKEDIMMVQFCISQGWVNRGCMDLYLCKNPDCKACRDFEKEFNQAMKQEARKYGKQK